MRSSRQLGCALALFVAVGGAGCSKKKELSVTGWEPKVGPYTGGGTVTIEGTGFQEGGARGVKVYFGDKEAKVLGWVGDDKLKIETPPGEIGQEVNILLVFDDAKDLTVDALTGDVPKEDTATPPPGGQSPPPSTPPPSAPPSGTAPATPPAGGTAPATPPAGGDAPK
ncbi:MAG TPA: IPT/TIG domain-containing protein [Kofleriaceae bacterium]|nr:IPT/TIG domain-containing protein [Kofleriaceae bacterium]